MQVVLSPSCAALIAAT
uniref:Uncharacterized protein n=1 Tax=Arundo donax TaxID=35708 RepID=A0A0A8XT54_ARUDO